MPQELSLQMVTRDDVVRIKRWLEDEEVSESWFGRYAYGDPAHLGYHPNEMDEVSDEEWDAVFDNPEHRMLSIYSPGGRAHRRGSLGNRGITWRWTALHPDRAQGPLASRIWLGCRSAHPRNRVHPSTVFTASGWTYRSTTPQPAACSRTWASCTKAHCARAARTKARASTPSLWGCWRTSMCPSTKPPFRKSPASKNLDKLDRVERVFDALPILSIVCLLS